MGCDKRGEAGHRYKGKENNMKLIALGETIAYIVTGKDTKKLSDEWEVLCRETAEYNLRVFGETYRVALGLPSGISPEEESKLVCEKYGKRPVDNPDFVRDIDIGNKEFKGKCILVTTEIFLEFAKSYNCKLEQADVFEI